MLQFARGKRVRLTCVQSGQVHFVKLAEAEGNIAPCWPEGDTPDPGEFVGECFSDSSFILFRANGETAEDGLFCLDLETEPKRTRLGMDLEFNAFRNELKVKSQFSKIPVRLFAAGPAGLGFESSRAMNRGDHITIEVQDEDKVIDLPATVVVSQKRGKTTIVFALLGEISRVQAMHWNRIVKAD